jgi:hypothetical protein
MIVVRNGNNQWMGIIKRKTKKERKKLNLAAILK